MGIGTVILGQGPKINLDYTFFGSYVLLGYVPGPSDYPHRSRVVSEKCPPQNACGQEPGDIRVELSQKARIVLPG